MNLTFGVFVTEATLDLCSDVLHDGLTRRLDLKRAKGGCMV